MGAKFWHVVSGWTSSKNILDFQVDFL